VVDLRANIRRTSSEDQLTSANDPLLYQVSRALGLSYAPASALYESVHCMSVMSNKSNPLGAGSSVSFQRSLPKRLSTCRPPTCTQAASARALYGVFGAFLHTNPGRLKTYASW
jgi:hypothetical protein